MMLRAARGPNPRWVWIPLIVLLAVLAVPAVVQADVRSASITDPADHQPPPEFPGAPPSCYLPDTAGLAVYYDEAGQIGVTHSYYSDITTDYCGNLNASQYIHIAGCGGSSS